MRGDFGKRLKIGLQEIAERYEFDIDAIEVEEDHVHSFLSAPPRYSPAQVVQISRSVSAPIMFKEFPTIKKQLWGGELRNDGYFVRSVGDKVTADMIRRYIKYEQQQQLSFDF